jgi:haloacetate dehalogenase
MFFDGFTLETIGGTRLRTGGHGPPLLLLHGQPQTHAMWNAVAPRLADRFTVICPDLPRRHTETDIASHMLALMQRLGHARFAVAGHDLGGHVACRMALDARARVTRLAALEIVPVPEHMDRADMAYSLAGYASCWFGQLHPKPEALATRAPSEWFATDASGGHVDFFHHEAVEDYVAADAGLAGEAPGIPADIVPVSPQPPEAGHRLRLTCPVLVIWGSKGRIGGWYDPLQLWRECVDNAVSGGPIAAGHFLAEERPDAVAAALRAFFAGHRPPIQTRAMQNRQNRID